VVLLDTHCHVDRFPDPLAIAEDCERQRVMTVAVTQLPSHYQMAMRHIGEMRFVRPALGFHPLAVTGNEGELPLFLSLLPNVPFVGEIGLDSSREGASSRSEQLRIFRAIAVDLAGKRKFVTLHSRGAEEEVADILHECGVAECVFHWFSGGTKALKAVIGKGHYFSINTAMVTSQKGRALLSLVPRNRILTETDGPYVKIGSRPAKPCDVKNVLSGIADVWGATDEDVEAQVTENFTQLCRSLGIKLGSDEMAP
jgi:TatD DNase family protein